MGKRPITSASEVKAVFVAISLSTNLATSLSTNLATSLSTNLAMTLSFSDTVGDFKRKIMLQHEQCFPQNGAITVHSLKIKHKGQMFHLESDMLVSSAFEGIKGRWDLYVDASCSLENVKEQNSFDSPDNGKLDIPMLPPLAIDAIPWRSPRESSQHTGSGVGRVNGTFQEGFSSIVNQELIEPTSKDDSKDQSEKFHTRNSYEARSGGDLKVKKKQKVKHSLHVSGKSALNVLRTSPRLEDSFVGSGPKVSTDVQQESNVIEKKEVYRHHSEDLSLKPQVSDTKNLSLERSVMVNKGEMASPDVPSQQVHVAISASTKKKKKIKRKHQVTNSNVPSDKEGGQILRNDESLLTLTGNLHNEYKEEDGQLSSKHDVLLSEDVKTSDLGERTPADKEVVCGLGILDTYPEADKSEVSMSKTKIKKSKKSAVHDLSAPPVLHIEDQTMRDEDILTQDDPKKREMKSELAKNHLDLGETNLNEKVSAPDILFDVRNDQKGDKSGSKLKKKKSKKSSSKSEYCVVEHIKDANDPLALKDSRSECISGDGDMMADQSIDGKKEQKTADSPKNVNNDGDNLPLTEVNDIQSRNEDVALNSGKDSNFDQTRDTKNVNNDGDNLPLTSVNDIQSRNENVALNSGKDSNFDQTRDKATVQDLVNNENVEETKSPKDQTDGERKNIGTTPKKRKKKAKRTENSISENLGIILESDNINDKELDSLVEKLCDVAYNTNTMKVNGSEEKQTFHPSGVSLMGPLPNNVVVKDIDQSQQILETGDNPKAPANEIESNHEVNPTAVNMESNGLVYEGENSSIYFRHYFVSRDDHTEAASTDKVDGETNVIEADEHKVMPEGKHKPSKSSGNQKNSRKRSKLLNKSVEPAVMDNSEENNGSLNSSNNSVSRDSKQTIINKSNQKKKPVIKLKTEGEVSRKKVKELDKSSQSQEKSLLTTPGLIFGDGLSESSGDENVNLKSGSITQSPSNSSSSSLSLSEDLLKEAGSINKDKKGGKTPLGSKLPNAKHMPLDMILRSSSRFKKAKLTASQSEAAAADTNSQQVDFVPESQPI